MRRTRGACEQTIKKKAYPDKARHQGDHFRDEAFASVRYAGAGPEREGDQAGARNQREPSHFQGLVGAMLARRRRIPLSQRS